ncbi:MAG TPA: ATP-binding cassette domain-containing protein [Candidatus Acidoferrales bacterium]|nr:ATP-binding cassette domain-containing protein [Candidatus Acidoferrales bacterium]
MSRLAVRIEELAKKYGSVVALDGITLAVERGKIFGLLGTNGAGKTTTVKILATLLKPDRGRAELCGIDVLSNPAAARAVIGYVPQEITVDPYLTAREHLDYYAGLYHVPAEAKERRIQELLELLGLAAAANRRARHFSGGMKKKLDLACGLVHQPQVALLDEPSLGLDVGMRRNVWSYIASLRRGGSTVFLCTNYMDEAEKLCDEVAIIDKGKIVALGSPEALKNELKRDLVALEVDHTDAQSQMALERLELQLREWTIVRATERNGSELKIYLEANETALPHILQTAGAMGISIQAVTHRRPALEDVFLHYTGHGFSEGVER